MNENYKRGQKPQSAPPLLNKMLPFNDEAERAVIATLIQYPGLFDVTLQYLKPEMFYRTALGSIYSIMQKLNDKEGTYDLVSIKQQFLGEKSDEFNYLVSLMGFPVITSNLDRYCMIVSELFIKRSCISIFLKYMDRFYTNDDVAELYDKVKFELDKVFNINEEDVNRIVQYEKSVLVACMEDEAALIKVSTKITPDIFYKSVHKDIYTAILYVMNEKNDVCMDSVSDVLKKHNNIIAVSELKNMLRFRSDDWPYHLSFLIDNNNVRILNKVAMTIIGHKFKKLDDIVDEIDGVLDRVRSKDVESSTMKSVSTKNLRSIRKNATGEDKSYLLSHEDILNTVAFISPNTLTTIAAMAGAGKTRWMIHIIKGMMELNPKLSIKWFCMEDPDEKILRAMICSDVGLTDAQMLSKNYELKDDEIKRIEEAQKKYEKYDIEFVNEPSSIKTIVSEYKTFVKKRPDRFCMLILDNFMLIDEINNANSNQTQVEDNIVAKLVKLRGDTNKGGSKSCLFVLHHLNKEVAMRANKEEAYRPKFSMLKGTSRIVDASNIVILINNIGQHKDLIKDHSNKPDVKCMNAEGEFKPFKRRVLMRNLLIVEVAKNRDGEIDDNKGIIRYFYDFSLMKFNHLICSR